MAVYLEGEKTIWIAGKEIKVRLFRYDRPSARLRYVWSCRASVYCPEEDKERRELVRAENSLVKEAKREQTNQRHKEAIENYNKFQEEAEEVEVKTEENTIEPSKWAKWEQEENGKIPVL